MDKKLFSFLVFIVVSLPVFSQGGLRGKVVDEKGEPIAYANVALLSNSDSTVICGSVTGDDGAYNLVSDKTEGILMVAMLGYQTRYLSPEEGSLVTLVEDSAILEGAVATAVMPKTKLTGEGLQTSVRGSVLEHAGTAADVLGKTPGIIKGQNGLEVIGKGAPLVYINGRKVTDTSELDRLQSNEIQSVEVISNPGAQYDATVRAVVRIRTVKRQGDGFSFDFTASDSQSLRWKKGSDPYGALNLNYRKGGLDFFGGVNYMRNTSRQESELEKATYGSDYLLENKGDLLAEFIGQSIFGETGVNWQIADNHFMGGKVEWGRQIGYLVHTVVDDNVWLDHAQIDRLTTTSDDHMGDDPYYNIGANLYYNGVVGEKLGIDVNFDYYRNSSPTVSESKEDSDMTDNALINSESDNGNHLYAAKAVLSYPLWKGQLQAGTEETFSRHSDFYTITGIPIPGSSAQVREDNYAGFASYRFALQKVGQFGVGARYEYVRYTYEDALAPENNLSREYGNLFPSLSFTGAAGHVQLMLNYSARTQRPNYDNLSNVIRYNNRYIWQSGNAQLQPDLSHNFGATAVWKFVTFVLNYSRTDNAIMVWSSPYGDQGVVLVKPRNIETPFRKLSAIVNILPTIGPWTMNLTLGVIPQWLTINAPDMREASGFRVTKFNDKPMGIARMFNTFRAKGGWQFELGGSVSTPGYSQNALVKNWYIDTSVAVQKILLPDQSLVLRLEASDLTRTAHYDVDTDFGNHTIFQTNLMDTQRVKFSLRYSFNTAQSKYRGTGAGSESKSRM